MRHWNLFLLLTILTISCNRPATSSHKESELQDLPPSERYGELFFAVQMKPVFEDGKTFADCTPKFSTATILDRYQKQRKQPDFELESFVREHFELPKQYASGFQSDRTRSAEAHINALWEVLTRKADEATTGTLIELPNPYIVPGGRFGEIYYWDSYFTMLGLQMAGRTDMIENMVDNFAYLIDTIGFIPNGNRTYFLSRSQPPFFASMVKLLAQEKSAQTLVRYLPQLQKEYDFWMDGLEDVDEPQNEVGIYGARAFRKVVSLGNGTILNRYFDSRSDPRAEMYRDDVLTAAESSRPNEQVYRDIRAACESGWDFSSRWLRDQQTLPTIYTTQIIPVDLNALLYNLEMTLAEAYQLAKRADQAQIYRDLATARKNAILQYCWDEETGYFLDFDFVNNQPTPTPSLAGMFPLYFEIATRQQALASAQFVEDHFLRPGGLVTTENNTGQQWDAPNGWAPLQWVSIQGLRNYQIKDLAGTVKQRWVDLNLKVYRNTGKMVEKYNVVDTTLDAGGGEYPVQDGFGWTNGVLLRLLQEVK